MKYYFDIKLHSAYTWRYYSIHNEKNICHNIINALITGILGLAISLAPQVAEAGREVN